MKYMKQYVLMSLPAFVLKWRKSSAMMFLSALIVLYKEVQSNIIFFQTKMSKCTSAKLLRRRQPRDSPKLQWAAQLPSGVGWKQMSHRNEKYMRKTASGVFTKLQNCRKRKLLWCAKRSTKKYHLNKMQHGSKLQVKLVPFGFSLFFIWSKIIYITVALSGCKIGRLAEKMAVKRMAIFWAAFSTRKAFLLSNV